MARAAFSYDRARNGSPPEIRSRSAHSKKRSSISSLVFGTARNPTGPAARLGAGLRGGFGRRDAIQPGRGGAVASVELDRAAADVGGALSLPPFREDRGPLRQRRGVLPDESGSFEGLRGPAEQR